MKVFSLFSGVGGFEMGLPPDYEVIGFSEIDKYASQVLKYRYPNVKNYGDIKKINWSEIPDFDLLTGGSPCQDFSIAGKRVGIDGARSGLVWEYLRCLKEKRPRYFIWENVKGVMSSRSGWDFANILTAFSEAGYSLWWQVLNAKDFGVPQNRERIFVIGFRDSCPPEVFFERGANTKDIQNLEPGANQAGRRYDTKGISPTIPTAGGGRHIPMINPVVAPTIRANHHNTADVHFIEDFFPGRVRKTKNSPAIRKGRQGIKVMTNETD